MCWLWFSLKISSSLYKRPEFLVFACYRRPRFFTSFILMDYKSIISFHNNVWEQWTNLKHSNHLPNRVSIIHAVIFWNMLKTVYRGPILWHTNDWHSNFPRSYCSSPNVGHMSTTLSTNSLYWLTTQQYVAYSVCIIYSVLSWVAMSTRYILSTNYLELFLHMIYYHKSYLFPSNLSSVLIE